MYPRAAAVASAAVRGSTHFKLASKRKQRAQNRRTQQPILSKNEKKKNVEKNEMHSLTRRRIRGRGMILEEERQEMLGITHQRASSLTVFVDLWPHT